MEKEYKKWTDILTREQKVLLDQKEMEIHENRVEEIRALIEPIVLEKIGEKTKIELSVRRMGVVDLIAGGKQEAIVLTRKGLLKIVTYWKRVTLDRFEPENEESDITRFSGEELKELLERHNLSKDKLIAIRLSLSNS